MYTHHARARQQQRGIPEHVIDLLLEFGDEEPAGGGAVRFYFSKKACKRLRSYLGSDCFSAVRRYIDVYAIVGEGGIRTCARQTRHRRRKR